MRIKRDDHEDGKKAKKEATEANGEAEAAAEAEEISTENEGDTLF